MPLHSKKQIFKFPLHDMVHSPIFPPASQAHKNWKNQRMYLTPTTWNPHSDTYVINEESMLDWEGNMKHEKIMRRELC